ncbi:MAG: 1-deoxy-D-xylulose-5-phosphate reductoisomerase [Deltaproteobacteria bacterium]|nr:1-deoxy-D-xylulose-5-phosphate reductoisomerase [Deltaproteobacteria bacterium]
MKKVSLLGSTGSIGTNTLDVIRQHPDRFQVVALAAGSNVELLAKQIKEFKPKFVAVAKKEGADFLKKNISLNGIRIAFGDEALEEAARFPEADTVVSAIVGAKGVAPTYYALLEGKTVCLANKESLVASGPVMAGALEKGRGSLIPVDSEHSAIHQSLGARVAPSTGKAGGASPSRPLCGLGNDVVRLILTASGGPFRQTSAQDLKKVTLEQALKHPNWSMGAKITIDSATMMNKGLEIIEAHWLFRLPPEKIAVTVHPQSIVHSMVEFVDGSVLAQLGNPDMRTPIAYALAYPERITANVPSLNLVEKSPLTFEEPDEKRFPALRLARQALEAGPSAPCVLNAANEVAVAAFLEKKIGFTEISALVADVLENHQSHSLKNLDEVFAVDRQARAKANEWMEKQR